MSVRSILALVAAAWCLASAFLIGDGRLGTAGEPPNQEIIGDPAAMAVHLVGRVLLVGVGLVALALVEWRSIAPSVNVTRD